MKRVVIIAGRGTGKTEQLSKAWIAAEIKRLRKMQEQAGLVPVSAILPGLEDLVSQRRSKSDGLLPVKKIAPRLKPSPVELRVIESAAVITLDPQPDKLAYQHAIFCQTALPYRRTSERVWERTNGRVSLRVEAGAMMNPETEKWVDLPLPFGPKARLIMIHLDSEAVRRQSPDIELEDSMTAFVAKLQGRSPTGPELRKFKEQAAAVAAASFRAAVVRDGCSFQVDGKMVTGFALWYPQDERQRTLWPSQVKLSTEYYESLIKQAVPLHPHAVAALAHNSMGLDIYKWLAQRLCRVHPKAPAFIPWPVLQLQFGQGYGRLRAFRDVFLKTLKAVQTQYPDARLKANGEGVTLYQSRPPIAPKQFTFPLSD